MPGELEMSQRCLGELGNLLCHLPQLQLMPCERGSLLLCRAFVLQIEGTDGEQTPIRHLVFVSADDAP